MYSTKGEKFVEGLQENYNGSKQKISDAYGNIALLSKKKYTKKKTKKKNKNKKKFFFF